MNEKQVSHQIRLGAVLGYVNFIGNYSEPTWVLNKHLLCKTENCKKIF